MVDDEPDLREALAQMLAFLGHTVSCAESGEQALEQFGQGHGFDLVVTDLSMPGMGGIGLIKELRAHRPELPIIVFSGLDENVARGMTAKLTNIHYLKKPFTFHSMTAAITAAAPLEEQGE